MKADVEAEGERRGRERGNQQRREVSQAIDTVGINLKQYLQSNIYCIKNNQPSEGLIIPTFLTRIKICHWLG